MLFVYLFNRTVNFYYYNSNNKSKEINKDSLVLVCLALLVAC